MERAIEQILIAFARGECDGGSIDWFDLELAFEYAREAMPGHYLKIVHELGGSTDDAPDWTVSPCEPTAPR